MGQSGDFIVSVKKVEKKYLLKSIGKSGWAVKLITVAVCRGIEPLFSP